MATRAPALKLGGDFTVGVREYARAEAERREEEARAERENRPLTRMRDYGLMIPERGVPLDLEQFPFQEEWYTEEIALAEEVVWRKAAQVGMSGYIWRWGFQRADIFGDRIIDFFPTDDDVTDFADQRVEPSIADSGYLRSRIPAGNVKHKHLKQVGLGFVAFRGTQSASAVQSVDADGLIFDEYEYLHQGNLEQAERRIAGAKQAGRSPRIRRLGYPILPGGPIDQKFRASDQRYWHVTCPACDLEQRLTWKDNVRWQTREGGDVCRWGKDEFEERDDVHRVWRQCRDCGESLEPEEGETVGPIHRGRWVPMRPGARVIGYHVSRLIVPRTDLAELVRNSRKTRPEAQQAFWNNDLGEPFAPSEAALTEDDIMAASSFGIEALSQYRARNPIVAGLDVADERDLSMCISEILPGGRGSQAVHISEPSNFDEVADLMMLFRIAVIVVDAQPARRMARAFAAAFPGRVHLAEYEYRNEADAFRYDEKRNVVRINRTEGLDAMMDAVRHATYRPLRTPPPKYVEQLMAPKRQVEEDTKGRPVRKYVSTGPLGDDYAHAEVYNLVAREMYRLRVAAGQLQQQAQGTPVSDEHIGIGRRRSIDSYTPGRGGR